LITGLEAANVSTRANLAGGQIMSSTAEHGRRGDASVVPLAPRDPSVAAARARGRVRRRARGKISTRAVELTDRLGSRHLVESRQGKGIETTENSGQVRPENVEDLAKYLPGSKKYQVSLTFSGEAGTRISELMATLDVDTPNELVKITIALFLSAQGKEILFRDPRTGVVEVVEV
jgi:hypothetical protein